MPGMDERLDGWTDGLIGGHSARCEIFSGCEPLCIFWTGNLVDQEWNVPRSMFQVGSLPGQKGTPINVLNEGGECAWEIWEWVDQLTNGKNVSEQFQNGQTENGWKCAQVFHNGQINFRMCAKNSIHANWVR
jgi:hypothetical protein